MKFFLYLFFIILTISPLAALGDIKKEEKKPENKIVPGKVKVVDHLQNISVTVASTKGTGSGVLLTRQRGKETVTFVWTAAHVVSDLRNVRTVIDSKSGSNRTVVDFNYPKILRTDISDGETVGKEEKVAEVIRYSALEDLCLLRIKKKNYSLPSTSVVFYLEDTLPPLGSRLIHVGSLLGQMGSNSYTEGSLSQYGRVINKKVFDQTTVTAFPGSSGGGVFLEDGRMFGMVVRGAGETFNLIVPARRIRSWAKEADIEWAVDPKVPLPEEKDLKKLPIEDNGVRFSYAGRIDKKIYIFGEGPRHLGDQERRFPTFFAK